DKGSHHGLAQVILRQPLPARSSEAKRRCLAIASESLLALSYRTTTLYSDFPTNLGKLFRRDDPHWTSLSEIDCVDAVVLDAYLPGTDAPAAIEKIKVDLLRLAGNALPDPSILLAEPPKIKSAEEKAQGKPEEASHRKYPKATNHAGKKELTSKPNYALLEAQGNAGLQKDNWDGYRLPLHWNNLSPAELHQRLQSLNADLTAVLVDDAAWQRLAHACGRYISLFAELSLRQCWSLPLGRRGTLHYDPECGLIRRDLLTIAPRKDRPGRRRLRGRWWRTKLAREIVLAVRRLCQRHPGCRTLGELLEAVGLTYAACQELLNVDWPTSHRPEDARFAASLRPCLLSLGFHPALVARVSGDVSTVPPSDFYYLSFSDGSVHLVEYSFWRWAGLTPPDAPQKPDRRVGTPRAITADQFSIAIKKLRQRVRQACN